MDKEEKFINGNHALPLTLYFYKILLASLGFIQLL